MSRLDNSAERDCFSRVRNGRFHYTETTINPACITLKCSRTRICQRLGTVVSQIKSTCLSQAPVDIILLGLNKINSRNIHNKQNGANTICIKMGKINGSTDLFENYIKCEKNIKVCVQKISSNFHLNSLSHLIFTIVIKRVIFAPPCMYVW